MFRELCLLSCIKNNTKLPFWDSADPHPEAKNAFIAHCSWAQCAELAASIVPHPIMLFLPLLRLTPRANHILFYDRHDGKIS
jgi:hypothetical protein